MYQRRGATMLAPGIASASGSGGAHSAADEAVASLVEGALIDVTLPVRTFPNALPASDVSESAASVATRTSQANGVSQPLGTDEQLLEGITRCRMRAWARSSECQNLIHIILAMCARPCYAFVLPQILVAQLPQFLMQSPEDAFFAVLDDPALSIFDHDLRNAVWTFLGTWSQLHLATYEGLLMDEHVFQVSSRCLPENVPLYTWIQRRMPSEIYFAEADLSRVDIPRGGSQLVVTAGGFDQVLDAYERTRDGASPQPDI